MAEFETYGIEFITVGPRVKSLLWFCFD